MKKLVVDFNLFKIFLLFQILLHYSFKVSLKKVIFKHYFSLSHTPALLKLNPSSAQGNHRVTGIVSELSTCKASVCWSYFKTFQLKIEKSHRKPIIADHNVLVLKDLYWVDIFDLFGIFKIIYLGFPHRYTYVW